MFNKAKYILTTHDVNLMPKGNISEVVIVGRSNVGKSSFINAITSKKELAFSSSKPGKTKAISFFDIDNKFLLVDVPGYGFAKVSRKQKDIFSEMMDSFFKRKQIKGMIVLLDSRIGITEDDLDIISFAKQNNIKLEVIGTKGDKTNQSERYHFSKIVEEELKVKPIIYSIKDNKAIEKAQGLILSFLK